TVDELVRRDQPRVHHLAVADQAGRRVALVGRRRRLLLDALLVVARVLVQLLRILTLTHAHRPTRGPQPKNPHSTSPPTRTTPSSKIATSTEEGPRYLRVALKPIDL